MIATNHTINHTQAPTLWGLDALRLHERFWASRAVQIVRRGDPRTLSAHADLYLLLDQHDLVLFNLHQPLDTLTWRRAELIFIRLQDPRPQPYREKFLADADGRFLAFQRAYQHHDTRLIRIAITPHRWLAQRWQHAPDAATGWRSLRRSVPRHQRAAVSLQGQILAHNHPPEQHHFVCNLVQQWRRPDLTIPNVQPWHDNVWANTDPPTRHPRFIGPVWLGNGQQPRHAATILGPAALYDNAPRFDNNPPRFDHQPTAVVQPAPKHNNQHHAYSGKRIFDLLLASLVLLAVLPIFPLIMLAIWIEDGRPFFFAHQRETIHGRSFPCLKFRSMRNNAEQIKQNLINQNQVDGPQFFIRNDPRVTTVGRLLRKTHLDELPQLFNVITGDMSIVGPRPSPYTENQCCPAWREARLSVRPGITGLWQVMRTRRHDEDFQEWIRYDLDYIDRMSWTFDLYILYRTILHLLRPHHT